MSKAIRKRLITIANRLSLNKSFKSTSRSRELLLLQATHSWSSMNTRSPIATKLNHLCKGNPERDKSLRTASNPRAFTRQRAIQMPGVLLLGGCVTDICPMYTHNNPGLAFPHIAF